MAADEGLQIAGYYAAAENLNDNSIEKLPGARILEKITEHMSNAVCIMVKFKHSYLYLHIADAKLKSI